MHISITDDWKKRFHAACALRGQKMSQVITELVEQRLKANEAFFNCESKGQETARN